MKKKINLVFFGVCFLASLLAEAYCLLILDGDIFSTAGVSIVVLLTGYLLLDAIRGEIRQGSQKVKFLLEQLYREETEKASERYTEMLNINKASYSSVKKNSVMVNDKFEELFQRLNSMERSNINALQKVADMQKKSMEGQKNALNYEINYNKENTKQLIKAIREESGLLEKNHEQLVRILTALENGGTVAPSSQLSGVFGSSDTGEDAEESFEEYARTEDGGRKDDPPEIIPLYADPNKELTKDEIASLFETYGK